MKHSRGAAVVLGLALACAPVAKPTSTPLATERAQPEPRAGREGPIAYELGAPEEGICRPGWARGCTLLPFFTTCSSFLSANQREIDALLRNNHLGLRVRGDRAARSTPITTVPTHAHRAFVGSGITVMELAVLAEALGIAEDFDPMWPPDEVVVRVAYMDAGAGILFRISPAISRVLAVIDSPEMRRALAQKWDKKTREHARRYEDEAEEMVRSGEWPKSEGPKREYGPDSASECADLLERIVPVALDAVTSHRELFVVSSLNHIESEPLESEELNSP